MFALGLAAGAADEIQAGKERQRQRIERQVEEARAYATVAQKRQAEADAARTRIQNLSKSFGVSDQVLFSAYRNGDLDNYEKLITDLQNKAGERLDPSTLEAYYDIPASVKDNPIDISKEFNRIYGVVEQGVQNLDTVDDYTAGQLFVQAIGGDVEGAAKRGLRGQTVQGFDVESLLNLPPIMPIEGDGGSINPSLAYDVARKGETEKTSFSPEQVATAFAENEAARIRAFSGGQFDTEATNEAIKASINWATRQVIAREGLRNPEELIPYRDEILESVLRQKDGVYYLNTNREKDGEFVWVEVKERGILGNEFKESELFAPEETEEDLSEEGSNVPPEGYPETFDHPDHGTMVFVRTEPDGAIVYVDESGTERKAKP